MAKRKRIGSGFALLVALGVALVAAAPRSALPPEARSAIIIGNADYGFAPLVNALNDARAMAGVLGELGFKVHLLEDASNEELRAGLEVMREELAYGGLGIFYYAGHAVEYQGVNYLLPTDFDVEAGAADLSNSTLEVTSVVQVMEEAGFEISVVILDACRDYPFDRHDAGFGRGLADIVTKGETLVAYATAAGQVAFDGVGPNSPYTAALVSALDLPGHSLYDIFRIVRGKVREATNGRQLPWITGSIESQIVLREEEPAGEILQIADVEVDQVLWQAIRSSVDPADFERFVQIFPDSELAREAIARRDWLNTEGFDKIAPLLVSTDVAEAPGGRTLEVTACDVWASDPYDPRRIAPGVEWGLVNTRAAIRDCAAAVAESPNDPRLNFNFARALDIAERFEEAQSFYRRAAEQGYAAALKSLGYMYRTARGTERDFELAAELYYLAALQGMPGARNALGKLFELGWGVPQSLEESLRWISLAADDGFAPAMDHMGNALRDGRGLPADPLKALEYYQAGAAFGNTNAMTNLARMYRDGAGADQDIEQALFWYQRATEEGNPYAPYHWGQLYQQGELVEPDARRALALFELSADRGFEWAYWQIARIHERGDLGEPDPVQAYYHLLLARAVGEELRNQGSVELLELASAKLEEVGPQLDEATAAATERRAETWLEQNSLHKFTLISPY